MSDVVLCGRCGAEQRTDPQILCEQCGSELHGNLRSVLEVLVMLRDTAARRDRIDKRGGNDDDVRRTLDARFALTAAATASPVSFGASDAALEVRRTITRWSLRLIDTVLPELPRCTHVTCREAFVRDLVGPVCATEHASAVRYDERVLADRAVPDWIADRWQLIRRQTWGPACADEVARVIRRAYALVDAPPETWFAGTCDVELDDPDRPGTTYLCGWQLDARLDEVIVRCRGCGTQHDVAQRRARMLERMPDVLVTAADAARALSTPGRPVTAAMVRGWRHRGHLQPEHGPDGHPLYDDRGAPLYRLADVQAADRIVRYGGDPNRTRGPRAS